MKLYITAAALFALAACATDGHDHSAEEVVIPAAPSFEYGPITAEALTAHIRILASDEFEGRAPGGQGERLTVEYLERTFAAAGLQPGVNGAWRQEAALMAATLTNEPVLTIRGRDGVRQYVYGQDFTAWTKRVEPVVNVENAELVFVGYGIVAPELNWNDYAGIDMRGKIAVILINDPDFDTGDDRGFGGRAMTYYGRWTYKYEEAAPGRGRRHHRPPDSAGGLSVGGDRQPRVGPAL